MAENRYSFDEQSAKRIADAVRRSERGGSLGGGSTPTSVGNGPPIYARITAVHTDLITCAWQQVRRQEDGTWANSELSGTIAKNPAIEVNGLTGIEVGAIVVLTRLTVKGTSGITIRWTYQLGGSQGTVLVVVTGNHAMGGVYTGVLFNPSTDDPTLSGSTWTPSLIGTNDSTQCIIISGVEQGQTTHWITQFGTRTLFLAKVLKIMSDGKYLVLIDSLGGSTCT